MGTSSFYKCRSAFSLTPKPYLDGQGDLVSRLVTPITHIVNLIIPIIHPLTNSPITLNPKYYSLIIPTIHPLTKSPITLNPKYYSSFHFLFHFYYITPILTPSKPWKITPSSSMIGAELLQPGSRPRGSRGKGFRVLEV